MQEREKDRIVNVTEERILDLPRERTPGAPEPWVPPLSEEEAPRVARESWLDRPVLAAISLDREKALYVFLTSLAVLTRLWDLGVRVMSHDETVHVQWSWYLYANGNYEHTPLSHGPFLFHANALNYFLFGDNDVSARLIAALLGIVLVALPYTMRRWLGRTGALVASLFFLISPSLLYYSRYIRHDIPIIVWALLAIVAIFRYLEDKQGRWLMVLAAAQSLMFATKEVSFIYIAIYGSFLLLLFFARMGAPRWRAPTWEQLSRVLVWIAVGTLLMALLTFGLSGIFASPASEQAQDAALPQAQEPALPEVQEPASEAGLSAADFLGRIAAWSLGGTVVALLGYVGLLALGSLSHRSLVLTVLGVVAVAAVAMGLLLFSLNLVELFPIRYRACEQPPVPGVTDGQLSCEQGGCELIQGRCQRTIPVVANDGAAEYDSAGTRIAIRLTRLEILIALMLIATIALMAGVGVYTVLDRLMPFHAGERPTLDLILFIGSFTLPFLSALAINGVPGIVSRLFFGVNATFNSLDYSEAGLVRSAGFVLIFLSVAVAVGVWWDWRRWFPAAAVFYAIFVVLFTTVFTNGNGLASGMVGSLGYWLEQQDVQRGSQPLYYYALIVPLYEYLPLVGFVAAAIYALARRLSSRARRAYPVAALFVLFVFLWTVLNWLAYSFAGEKMPWLTTHFAVPMALAAAWVVGRLIERTNWQAVLRRGGWVLFLVAPVGLAALVQTISPWLGGAGQPRPFSGQRLDELNATMQFVAALLVLSISLAILYWVWQRIGWAAIGRTLAVLGVGLLAVLTIRTAWIFAYVNYDYANEFLVYAHSTPDVREVMEQIEDISRRTSGDLSLDIGYTSDGSYPFLWYLRNYSNAAILPNPPSRPDLDKPVIIAGDGEWAGIEPYIGDNFVCNRYVFLWWPMQDYFNLTWDRVRYALFNPEMRAAVWDIILRRDYRKYEQATDKTVRLSQWPQRNGFRFCVRQDVRAQVWSESAGPMALGPEAIETSPEQPDYVQLEQPVFAEQVVADLGSLGNLNGPHGLASDTEGYLYMADSNNHRVVKFSPEGQVVDTWDSTWWRGLANIQPGCVDAAGQPLALGDGEFCEPWGIAVGPQGQVYVADTWNHRVQVFTSDGQFVAKIGTFGQSGNSVSQAPTQFYGPRDVAVDREGRIFVTDTGNKRIQVFDADLNFLFAFGGPGIVSGRLDEPVGLDIGPDDLLYVADTWNLRIQVFALDGTFVREWPVAGWESQSIANKPYLAIDDAGRVYVTDPEAPRVVVFDSEGTPLITFKGAGESYMQAPTGIVLDGQARVWVSDASAQRLLRFPPLIFPNEPQEIRP